MKIFPSFFSNLKKFMPEGLYSRSLLIIIVPVVLLQGILTFVFLDRHWQLVTRKLSSAVASEIVSFLDIKDTIEFSKIKEVSKNYYNMNITFIPNQKIKDDAPKPLNLVENTLGKELLTRLENNFWIDAHSLEKQVIVQIEDGEGLYQFLLPRRNVYATNSHIFLVWMVISSLLLLSVAIMFMRQQIKPIEQLSKAAHQFGLGMKTEDLKPSGATEVRRAAEAYLKMQERIERFMEQRTLMLAGVSHDLRTPLTRLKLQIEILPNDSNNNELLNDVNEMQKMLETYLDFAQGITSEDIRKVQLKEIVEEIINIKKDDIEKIIFHNNLSDEFLFECKLIAMKRCISNLINNACAYGNKVVVTLNNSEELIQILVEDDGPGINEKDYEQATKPFQRLDLARNQNISGSGLGLSISQDITNNHGGQMKLSKSHLGGLKVSLEFPRNIVN